MRGDGLAFHVSGRGPLFQRPDSNRVFMPFARTQGGRPNPREGGRGFADCGCGSVHEHLRGALVRSTRDFLAHVRPTKCTETSKSGFSSMPTGTPRNQPQRSFDGRLLSRGVFSPMCACGDNSVTLSIGLGSQAALAAENAFGGSGDAAADGIAVTDLAAQEAVAAPVASPVALPLAPSPPPRSPPLPTRRSVAHGAWVDKAYGVLIGFGVLVCMALTGLLSFKARSYFTRAQRKAAHRWEAAGGGRVELTINGEAPRKLDPMRSNLALESRFGHRIQSVVHESSRRIIRSPRQSETPR